MNQTILTVFIVTFIVAVGLLPKSEAKFYNDYMSINSRVPGDQELLRSTVVQNLNFYAKVTLEVRYPEALPHSNYMLSHIYFTGQDDTGYIDSKFDQGGPGVDFMRMKILLNSVQNGKYQFYLYGKKK